MQHWKQVSEGARLEEKLFWPVLTCFWPVYLQYDRFFALAKKSGTDCPKKIFGAKIWFVTCKTWYKSQKIHPLCLKNPAEIQETSFGHCRIFFFKLLLAYTWQLELISVKSWALGIISWFSAQIRRDGGSWWAGWASAHPEKKVPLSCSQYSQTICWCRWSDNACLGVRNTCSIGAWPNSIDRRPPWYCIVSPLLQTKTYVTKIYL
jgi:hypothetical protein